MSHRSTTIIMVKTAFPCGKMSIIELLHMYFHLNLDPTKLRTHQVHLFTRIHNNIWNELRITKHI